MKSVVIIVDHGAFINIISTNETFSRKPILSARHAAAGDLPPVVLNFFKKTFLIRPSFARIKLHLKIYFFSDSLRFISLP
jgi:hypothetical protein